MMIRPLAAAALLLTLVVPLAGTTTAADEATPTPGKAADVWLKGAFGRVLGADPVNPAAAEPGDRPLDTWIRRAPFELEVDVPFEELLAVSVASRSRGDDGRERLSTGATQFEGPDRPGLAVVVATVTTEAGGTAEYAWLVDVPDREPSPDALFDIPGPSALLTAGAAVVTGAPASGCYAYLCVDVGEMQPVDALEVLRVGVGETLSLELSDGSAMAGWTGTLTPLDGTRAERITAAGLFSETPQAIAMLGGLETTTLGEWLLELRADYDRERGWQWFTYRLLAE
jgi:hypothetical protein